MQLRLELWLNRPRLPVEVSTRPDPVSPTPFKWSRTWQELEVGTEALRELNKACIVVLTGVSDYISDGDIVLKVSNGHELVSLAKSLGSFQLGVITGSGCMTGSLIATFCAAARIHHLATTVVVENDSRLVQGDMLVGALSG